MHPLLKKPLDSSKNNGESNPASARIEQAQEALKSIAQKVRLATQIPDPKQRQRRGAAAGRGAVCGVGGAGTACTATNGLRGSPKGHLQPRTASKLDSYFGAIQKFLWGSFFTAQRRRCPARNMRREAVTCRCVSAPSNLSGVTGLCPTLLCLIESHLGRFHSTLRQGNNKLS